MIIGESNFGISESVSSRVITPRTAVSIASGKIVCYTGITLIMNSATSKVLRISRYNQSQTTNDQQITLNHK